MRMRAVLGTFFAVQLAGTHAWANVVDVSVTDRAVVGQGLPAVTIHIQKPIAGFELKLQRSDGTLLEFTGSGNPGAVRVFPLSQPEGRHDYRGELTVHLPDADVVSMPLQFQAELVAPLRISIKPSDVDLVQRTLRFTLSRPAERAYAQAMLDDGKLILDSEIRFHGEPAGTPLQVTWPAATGRVIKIAIRAYDTSSFFTAVELFPWQVEVPHEDINFESAKWEIRGEDRGKLERSCEAIREGVSRYGWLAPLKLFIAGYTDTVGTAESNRVLSINRARAIGSYFRRCGVRIPILYAGFGEDVLLVPTPDETDEPRNRRADYILSIESPALKLVPFEPNWQRL